MRIGDTVAVNLYGGSKHVGIITDATEDTAYCDEWYGLNHPNCIKGAGFYKKVLKTVNKKLFIKAKEKWENRPEPIVDE